MDVNATGVFLMAQAVGRVMVEQGRGGRIINVASIAGLKAEPPDLMEAIGYNASKGAVVAFTRSLAAQWAKHNILVNALAPGFFPSKMTRWLIANRGELIAAHSPLARPGQPGELKGAAVFLASDAATYVTGQVLAVDGGATAW
jgi:gluconate 5-dehydrogenase